jgi:C4-dicarboxylate transporter, DctQ subunit
MILRVLDRLEEILLATILAAMTVLTFSQVVLRYAFNSGFIWSLEATTYLFGWLVLIGISYGLRTDSHIAVELVTDRLPPAAQKVVALIAVGLSLLYALLMFFGSWTLIGRLHAFGNLAHDIPLPRWLLLSFLPVGFGLLALRIGQAAIGICKGTRHALGQQSDEPSVDPDEGDTKQ